MKRLTHIDHIGWYIEDQRVAFDGRRRGWDVDRLAAYEDTGLEPKEVTAIKNSIMGQEIAKITEFDGIPIRRLQELAQAEKDGRLVVLQKTPPQIGDTIYEIVGNAILENLVTYVDLQRMSCGASSNEGGLIEFYLCEIGETIFLTCEEAEAALKKREEADDEAD